MAPIIHDPKPTFAGGEFSPEMQARIDVAKYASGLKTARNGFIHPQGGFSNRSGFRMVAAAKFSDKGCRLIPFEFSDSQSYMIEVGLNYMRFFVNGAQITFGGNPYEISTPYLDTELWQLKYTQSADTLYLAHPDHAPMTLVRVTDTNWTLAAFPFKNGPFGADNTDDSLTMALILQGNTAGLTSSTGYFQAGHVGVWFRINSLFNPQTVNANLTNGQSTSRLIAYKSVNLQTTGTWSGTISVRASEKGGPPYSVGEPFVLASFSSASDQNFNVNIPISYESPVYVHVVADSITAGSVTVTLTMDSFTFSFDGQVYSVNSSTSCTLTMSYPDGSLPLNGFNTDATNDWAEGAWSPIKGWPSAVTFYQDRLGWATTPSNPLGNWWSQTGNYVDYGVSDPLVDSDAISVNIPTRKVNQVKHLLPMYVVLALTSSGEVSIGPGGSGDFSPTSIDLRPQTYHGAADVPPVIVGNQAIFVQARSSQVRSISYQYFTNIFTGEILNLVSSHLFDNYTLTDMTYAESPYSLIFAVRSDGQLLCFTYLPEQQVSAWTHWDTDGEFESCAVIPTASYDELWVIVNRPFGKFIERLAQRLPTFETKDQFHVDCGIDYNGSPTTGISGLDYLNGQSVICLADGLVQGPFTVVNGSITLSTAASLVHIGLPYTTDIETLNIERAGQDGTSQDRRTRVTQATPRFVNSLGGYIGPNSSKLHPIVPSPAAPPPGSYRPLFTGDIPKISIAPDWKSNGRIFFRQTDPLPFTLSAVFLANESGNI